MIKQIKKYISSLLIETSNAIPKTNDLANKVIVITGASRGIGKAIAEVLLREEAYVVAIARSMTDLETAYKNTNKEKVMLVSMDITQEVSVREGWKTIQKRFSKIDVLINNAGIFPPETHLENISLEEFTKATDTNIKGMFLLTKTVLPTMKKHKNGYIINIGSKISHNTNIAPKKVLYAMTKYAVEGFSLALRKELREWNIRVTCLMPGTVNTFVSFKSKTFIAPLRIGHLIATMIKMDTIEFESIIFTSKEQNL